MGRSRVIPAITAALEDSEGAVPVRFRWLKRGVALVIILWVAMGVTWVGLLKIANRRLAAEVGLVGEGPLYPGDFKRAGPPLAEADNAVHYIRLAVQKLQPIQAPDTVSWEELNTYPLTDEAKATLATYLKSNAEVLELIRRARTSPGVDWGVLPAPIDYRQWDKMPEPIRLLNQMRDLTDLPRQAALLARSGRDEPAMVEYLRDAAGLARIAGECPSGFGDQVVYPCELAAAGGMVDVMAVPLDPSLATATAPAVQRGSAQAGRASKQQFAALIADMLEETRRTARARRAFLGERAAFLASLQMPYDASQHGFNAPDTNPLPEHAKLIQRLLAPHDRFHAAGNFRAITRAADAVSLPDWPSASRISPPWVGRGRFPPLEPPLATWLRSNTFYPWQVEYRFRLTVVRRLAPVLLAIRLYQRDHAGGLPADLEALVPEYLPSVPLDPYASPPAPMRYAPHAKFPLIYSVYDNGVDDVAAGYQPDAMAHQNWQGRDYVVFIDVHAVKAAEAAAAATQPVK